VLVLLAKQNLPACVRLLLTALEDAGHAAALELGCYFCGFTLFIAQAGNGSGVWHIDTMRNFNLRGFVGMTNDGACFGSHLRGGTCSADLHTHSLSLSLSLRLCCLITTSGGVCRTEFRRSLGDGTNEHAVIAPARCGDLIVAPRALMVGEEAFVGVAHRAGASSNVGSFDGDQRRDGDVDRCQAVFNFSDDRGIGRNGCGSCLGPPMEQIHQAHHAQPAASFQRLGRAALAETSRRSERARQGGLASSEHTSFRLCLSLSGC
jgi:hypothetical protein